MNVDHEKSLLKLRLRRWLRSRRLLHQFFTHWKFELWKITKGVESATTQVVSRDTDLVIDGFPRSANSFIYGVLLTTQDGLCMAHHAHSASQILMGVSRKLPTVVIVRDPREAVLAQCAYDRSIPLIDSIRDWIAFYERVLPKRDGFVVIDFGDFTRSPVSMVHKVNRTYPGLLREFSDSDAEEKSKEFMNQRSRKVFGMEKTNALPSAERSEHKDRIRGLLAESPFREEMDRAVSIYERISAGD